MRLAILGCGYVGLVTGVCLANSSFFVHCVDIDKRKVRRIEAGEIPFHEPGLAEALELARSQHRFLVGTDVAAAVATADVVFIAVGTPTDPDGSAELSCVEAAAAQIARSMQPGCVVVTKSTVPVGTGVRLRGIIEKIRPGVRFSIASNPEFLREGSAIDDFMNPSRIVLGVEDVDARRLLRRVYAPLEKHGATIVETSIPTAEMIKYVTNAFLATKVAFVNEVADLCEAVGTDVEEVATVVGLDPRIGQQFLHAGPGFGGSCFPKDIRAFAAIGAKEGRPQRIVEQVDKSNEARKVLMAQRIVRLLGSPPNGRVVGVLGVAFKAHTDDVRESPSLAIIRTLQAAGLQVRAHDYAALDLGRKCLPDVTWCTSPYAAAKDADVVAILTDWPKYRELNLAKLATAMRGKVIFDTRRIISVAEAMRNGLDVVAIGRANARPRGDLTSQEKRSFSSVSVGSSCRKIMVAGGAGFLGSHLCERLLKEGHHVLCVDNLSTGRPQTVARLKRYRRFTFLEHDISRPLEASIDEIFNLACPASPTHYQADPLQTMRTNVFGAACLLELANHVGAKILQASTSEVYGDPLVHPQTETYWGHVNPIGIRACYDEGKRCAEAMFFDYARHRSVRVRVARIFNTYGPQMGLKDGRVVSNFIIQALSRKNLTIYGDGKQTRSFCYVDDLIEGLIRFMNSPDTISGPLNFGNPEEYTVLQLAKLIKKMTRSPSRVVFLPLPEDDPQQRRPDISKAEKILGWRPEIGLADGLARTISYFTEMFQRGSMQRLDEKVA